MEKIILFEKECEINKIDYIGIDKEKGIVPIYRIFISYNNKKIIIPETETCDELKIARVLQTVKEKFLGLDHFVSIYRSSPLINIYRAKNLELKKCTFTNRNYLEITLHNGSIYETKPENMGKFGDNNWHYLYHHYQYMSKKIQSDKEK